MTKSSDSSPEWGSRSCQCTCMPLQKSAGAMLLWRVHNAWVLRIEPRVGLVVVPGHSYANMGCAEAASLCGEYTMTKSSDSSPEWGSRSCQCTCMLLQKSAGAMLLWRVHNDWILIIEPRVRLAVMPEHSYADTRLRWFDVVVESPQRLSLKNRAQSGARGRAGALVGKYGVALVRRRCVESTQRLSPMIRAQSEARGRASALGCLYKMALVRRYCGESTMTGLKNRAQSEARGHVGALVCKYEIALVRRCCGEYTTTKS